MEKWLCCGHDIIKLCDRAGCKPPERCFFCGELRTSAVSPREPEDWLAFELAELWAGKIREYHGDPESHFPSFDQYGRTDAEAWRAVARRVFDLMGPLPETVPDPQSTRVDLTRAMQAYATERESGWNGHGTSRWTNLLMVLDRHELAVTGRALHDLMVKRLKRGS